MRHSTRWIFGLLTVVMLAAQATPMENWQTSWSSAPDSPGPALHDQTLRQIVRISTGGTKLRVRLSNLMGHKPVTLGPASVAISAGGASIDASTLQPLRFNGKTTIHLRPGESVLSDPVSTMVAPLSHIAVSLYVPDSAGPSTLHSVGMATGYLVDGHDAVNATNLPDADTLDSRIYLTGVEVADDTAMGTLVTLGDSITDGYGSTPDKDQRWPDLLAERLNTMPSPAPIAIANAGISGNQLLGLSPGGIGQSMMARLTRDVFEQHGVRWLVIEAGINDIAAASEAHSPHATELVDRLTRGMQEVVMLAHQHHIKVIATTTTPFRGAPWPFHTKITEAQRQALNTWIRSSPIFDKVVDFDQIVRDPMATDRLAAGFDSGDHIHPNGEGYRALAAAFDPAWFKDEANAMDSMPKHSASK